MNPPPPPLRETTLALCLASHTNAGKTTLTRTLLGRDVGEVRDAAHVTDTAEAHDMVTTPAGERLVLWDTPGFGDSVRLARRLALASGPIGWFLTEVWDRFRDRPFWMAQRALRTLVQEADVVLYLIDTQDDAEPGGALDAELEVLRWLRKPVLVLLNQTGQPRSPADEATELERWHRRVGQAPAQASGQGAVREVLSLDAFARCWVQERILAEAIGRVLPQPRQALFGRLQAAWMARAEAVWRASMDQLASRLADVALDSEAPAPRPLAQRLQQQVLQRLRPGSRRDEPGAGGPGAGAPADGQTAPEALGVDPAEASARRALAERHAQRVRAGMDALIALHGLDGRARAVLEQRMADAYTLDAPMSASQAAAVGGAVTGVLTGALTGLKVDVASAGLTLGGGLLAGALLGAAGGAGLARTWNRLRGRETAWLRWSDGALELSLHEALLGYLAVAHYGRGRGAWIEAEAPPHWPAAVRDAIDRHRTGWLQWLSLRRELEASGIADGEASDASRQRLQASLQPWLRQVGHELLRRLYPQVVWTPAAEAADPDPAQSGERFSMKA